MAFFQLSTLALTIGLLGIVLGATLLGHAVGRALRGRPEGHGERFAVMQAAMLGFMGLVLAFGLSLAVGRYENRRAAVVDEANALGTSYLRAQTLPEPMRTQSLTLLRELTDVGIDVGRTVPASAAQDAALSRSGQVESALWTQAGLALDAEPTGSAVRLYVESLNETIDARSTRVFGLRNRVPMAVLGLEVVGAAIALSLLALHMSTLGRGSMTVLVAALLVTLTLVVTFDLDRPVRGLIQVSALPLVEARALMAGTPAVPAMDQAQAPTPGG